LVGFTQHRDIVEQQAYQHPADLRDASAAAGRVDDFLFPTVHVAA
jgi:hypothetical protein